MQKWLEFKRIAPGLRELGIMDRADSGNMMQKILTVPKNISAEVRRKTLQNIIIFPAVSTITSEGIGRSNLFVPTY